MEPKEKALRLCQQMGVTTLFDFTCNEGHTLPKEVAKKCALIAVDELIREQDMWQNGQTEPVKYWQRVREEIVKL